MMVMSKVFYRILNKISRHNRKKTANIFNISTPFDLFLGTQSRIKSFISK